MGRGDGGGSKLRYFKMKLCENDSLGLKSGVRSDFRVGKDGQKRCTDNMHYHIGESRGERNKRHTKREGETKQNGAA